MRLLIYTTLGCHLCDHAKAVISRVLPEVSYVIEEIDIANSETLLKRYGVRIPVVAMAEDPERELGWPFNEQQFEEWLNTRGKASLADRCK